MRLSWQDFILVLSLQSNNVTAIDKWLTSAVLSQFPVASCHEFLMLKWEVQFMRIMRCILHSTSSSDSWRPEELNRVKMLDQKLIFYSNTILLNLTHSVNAVMYTKECLNLWASAYLQHFNLEACLGENSGDMHFGNCAEMVIILIKSSDKNDQISSTDTAVSALRLREGNSTKVIYSNVSGNIHNTSHLSPRVRFVSVFILTNFIRSIYITFFLSRSQVQQQGSLSNTLQMEIT